MYKTKFLRWVAEKAIFNWVKDTQIRPEDLLISRIVFAFITGIVLAFGSYIYQVVFLTIYQLVFLFDYVDGKLARYRKEFSLRWRKFDRTAHYLTSAFFLITVSLSFYVQTENLLIFSVGVAGFLSIIATLLFDILNLKSMSFDKMKKVHEHKGIFNSFYSFLSIDGSFTLFFFLVVFNQLAIIIIFLSSLNLLILLKKANTYTKWRKKK